MGEMTGKSKSRAVMFIKQLEAFKCKFCQCENLSLEVAKFGEKRFGVRALAV